MSARVVHEHEREPAVQIRAAPSPARARARGRRSGARRATRARPARRRARSRWWSRSSVSSGVMPGSIPSPDASSAVLVRLPLCPSEKPGVTDRAVDRLRVLPRRRPGGGVAVVPDREVALQRGEAALVEHLGDEAHVLDDRDRLAVADRDAGRLLAAVLEREQPEVGEVGDRLARARTPRRRHRRGPGSRPVRVRREHRRQCRRRTTVAHYPTSTGRLP